VGGIMGKILYYLKNPGKALQMIGYRKMLCWIPDKEYIKIIWRLRQKSKLNLKSPCTYGEKLQWLKLNDHNLLYRTLVDKATVRGFIKNSIGERYLIPIIGVYNCVDDIPWNELPHQFVMKCTHDSGYVVICKDKEKLNIEKIRKNLKYRMSKSIYWYGREWQYKGIKPRIIIEKLLDDENDGGVIDYKVFCFNGKVKLFQVHTGRFIKHYQQFYNTKWELTNISHVELPTTHEYKVPKPNCFEEMVELSEKLSNITPHARIDWYYVGGQLYFSEYTFYDGSGFVTFEKQADDFMLGEWIDISSLNS